MLKMENKVIILLDKVSKEIMKPTLVILPHKEAKRMIHSEKSLK